MTAINHSPHQISQLAITNVITSEDFTEHVFLIQNAFYKIWHLGFMIDLTRNALNQNYSIMVILILCSQSLIFINRQLSGQNSCTFKC
jgi:hypothetical protein